MINKTTLYLIFCLFALLPPSKIYASEKIVSTSFTTITVDVATGDSPSSTPVLHLDSTVSMAQQLRRTLGRLVGLYHPDTLRVLAPDGRVVLEESFPSPTASIQLPTDQLSPGLYQVEINHSPVLNFPWGVLALNVDQSSYLLGQTAHVQMAALDDHGHTLCAAALMLTVTPPTGSVTSPHILASPTCGADNVTDVADYSAELPLEQLGTYTLTLTNQANGYTHESQLLVQNSPRFVIERRGATRINPFRSTYNMQLVVQNQADFRGIVTETLPPGFIALTPTSWQVNWQAGQTYTLRYRYRAPLMSPALYRLGPLMIGDFTEPRDWTVASDALGFTNLGASTDLGPNAATNPDINSNTDATSYANSSWSPPTSGLIVVFVTSRLSSGTPNEPTISGNGLTWTSLKTQLAGARRITLFGALAAGATTGVTTIDFAGQTQQHGTASFFQITGADLSSGLAGAFVQTPSNSNTSATDTTGTVTLAAAANSNNRAIAGFYHNENEVHTPRTNWTELDDMPGSAGVRGMSTQYRDDAFETTASASWTTAAVWAGIAAEIKIANSAPATPSLDSPADTATGISLTPALLTTTTDPDADYLRYKIELCENAGMTTNCQTFDQTSSQTGWSGQNAETSTAYTSGTQASFTLQSPLTNLTTYYWRSYAIDPGGSNSWSSTQGTPYSFTTIPASSIMTLEGINLGQVQLE